MGDDRPPVYFDPDVDRWVYRASSLGRCDRELVLWRQGQEGFLTPDWMQTRFDEGHEFERRILDTYLSKGEGRELRDHQTQVAIAVGKHAMVRGSIDGWDSTSNTVVDAKFLGPDLFKKLQAGIRAFPSYAWQQAVYAHGMGAEQVCLAMALKDVEGDGDERKVVGIADYFELWVDLDELPSVPEIKARVMRLEKMAAGTDLPACPDPTPFPCPFHHFHDDKFVEVTDDLLVAKIHRAQSLNAQARREERDAKAHKAEATEIIEQVLEELELDPTKKHRLAAGAVHVTWCFEEVGESTRTFKAHTRKYPRFSDREGGA